MIPLTSLFSQQEYWHHYYRGDQVVKTVETQDDIWIGTTVGLVRINKLTNQQEIFNKFTSDLPNTYIRNLIADHEGNIWIRTILSISKFDGINWTHFTSSNSILNIADNYFSLELDGKNRIWVTEFDRILYYENNDWVEIPAQYYPQIIADPNGTVWMSKILFPSQEKKIYRLDNDTWIDETLYLSNNFNVNYVYFLGFDSDGNLWSDVSGLKGVLKKDIISQGWTFIPLSTNFSNLGNFETIDKDGNIWYSNYSNGDKKIIKFSEPNSWEGISIPSSLGDVSVTQIIPDDNQGVWFSLYNNQTNRFTHLGKVDDQNQITTFEFPPFAYSYGITLTQVDDNSILVGGLGVRPLLFKNNEFEYIEIGNSALNSDGFNDFRGSSYHNKQFFTSGFTEKMFSYDFQNWESINLPNTGLFTLVNNEKEIWAISSGFADEPKIYSYQNSTWDSIDIEQLSNVNINNNHFSGSNTITQDGLDNLWIPVQGHVHGILKYNENNITAYNNDNSELCNNYVRIIGTDNNGDIWCNLQSCIQKFDRDSDDFEKVIDFDTLYHYFNNPYLISKMVQMNDGLYYFKESNSIVAFNGTQFESIDSTNSPFSDDIKLYNIEKDTADNLWITSSEGIFKYDRNSTWEAYNIYNSPLTSHDYLNLNIDKENNIWITSLRGGIYILSEKEELIPFPAEKKDFCSIYPNPFYHTATISFFLEKKENVEIEIIDVNGRFLNKVFEGEKEQGNHKIEFSLQQKVTGFYFCKITIGNKQQVSKLVFIN